MAWISSKYESSSRNFGGNLQLTNWILYSGATCYMTPEVLDFIPGLLEDTDKYIEVTYGNQIMAKQKGNVQIKMCDNNGDNFIAKLHNVLVTPDLCDGLFLIIKLINLEHNCLFYKRFCTVYFIKKENCGYSDTYWKAEAFILGKIKQMSKPKKIAPRKKVALELLHHRLVRRSNISLMAGDTDNVWQDIQLIICPDPFCTPFQIY